MLKSAFNRKVNSKIELLQIFALNIFTTQKICNFFRLATIALVIVLIGLQIFFVFNFPIWRDDAFFAIVAKSLANGEGYKAVFFDQGYSFHYGISSGPIIILPAALLIFIFGNHYWVPGLTNILLIWSLMIPIFILAKNVIGQERKWPFCFLSLFLILLFSYQEIGVGKLFLWHLLMGEVPATLCVILATFVIFTSHDNVKKLALGGLFLGFAALSKSITIMAITAIIAFITSRILLDKKLHNLRKIILISMPIMCFIAPLFLLELVKITFLGWEQYQDLQLQNTQFYESNSLVYNEFISGAILSLINFFGEVSLLLIPITIYLVYQSYKEKPKSHHFVIALTLICCFSLYVLWWVIFATPNSYRYLTTAFFCYFVGISLLVCGLHYKTVTRVVIVSTFLFYLVTAGMYKSSFELMTDRLDEQLLVVEAISKIEKKGYKMISCGNSFELEYLLPNSRNFQNCRNLFKDTSLQKTVLVNHFLWSSKVLIIDHDGYEGQILALPNWITSRCKREYLVTENFALNWCE